MKGCWGLTVSEQISCGGKSHLTHGELCFRKLAGNGIGNGRQNFDRHYREVQEVCRKYLAHCALLPAEKVFLFPSHGLKSEI